MNSKKKSIKPVFPKAFKTFLQKFKPLNAEHLILLTDHRTGAQFCECQVKATKLIELGTTDVALDPDDQSDYRANREIVANAPAYARMIDDAKLGRSFSNVVAEFVAKDASSPMKIIGGQHRFEAIRIALEEGVDELHGVKVYFDLDMQQRLDVQLISNTNIAISPDLFDRMHETVRGPELREWCQQVGLLAANQDFTDRRARGGPISVQHARTFIINYFDGKKIDSKDFNAVETTPKLSATGTDVTEWDALVKSQPDLWNDKGLIRAGKEFAKLIAAQRSAFNKKQGKVSVDHPEKALNAAIIAAWPFVAGVLSNNEVRLERHYGLAKTVGSDPLNVTALAHGRHKTDPSQYRGLGYRTDAKERARFAELFFMQAEKGEGITKSNINVAIAQYHAKIAMLEVGKLKLKAVNE